MKILHVTTLRALAPGHRKQLRHEVLAAREADLHWDTVSLQTDAPQSEFEVQVPRLWRSGIMLRVYKWLYVISKAGQYDIVLLRPLSLDLFGPIFGPFARNRVTVHHAKEIEELEVANKNAFSKWLSIFTEKWIMPLTMRSARGIAAVTNEILDYEVTRFPHLRSKSMVFPNGYHFAQTKSVADKRQEGIVNFTFVCSTFSEWHGLDRLLDALDVEENTMQKLVRIHLVGSLSERQLAILQATKHDRVEIVVHGILDFNEISSLLALTDVAIGSLALDRKSLLGASTLKVREYLASGVPVYATHYDTALPRSFPFYYADVVVSFQRMMKFAQAMAEYSRDEIREAGEHYLDKRQILERAVLNLAKIENICGDSNNT